MFLLNIDSLKEHSEASHPCQLSEKQIEINWQEGFRHESELLFREYQQNILQRIFRHSLQNSQNSSEYLQRKLEPVSRTIPQEIKKQPKVLGKRNMILDKNLDPHKYV